jgi:acyl-CoA synthetase (AMP-forming)/AMP-acid ligase II
MSIEVSVSPGHHDWHFPAGQRLDFFPSNVPSYGHSKNLSKDNPAIPELPLFLAARSHVLADPHKVAIIDKTKDQSFTYVQLLNDVAALKAQIQQHLSGYDPTVASYTEEPRIAFLAPAGYDYVVAQWAIWAAGAVAVPLCTSHPLKELQYTISDSDPSLILLHPTFQKFEAGLQEQAGSAVPIVPLTPLTQSSRNFPFLPRFTTPFPLSRRALMIYTSGTTSRPKGCISTHETIVFQARSLVEAWKYDRSDHLIHVLPLHHVHGIVNGLTATLLAGGTVEMYPKFDPKILWSRWSQKGSSTMFMAVPTVYSRLIDYFDTNIRGTASESAAREGVNALRLIVSGSAALPTATKRKFEEISGHELLERYGMTEIGMGLSCGLEREQRIDGSVGWPLPGVQVRLTEEKSGRVITSSGQDESGMIEIRGPNLFLEYFRRPESTAESFTQDGWFKTGDVAKREANGAYFILGRDSVDIIKSGGYKISALEVERKILGNEALSPIVSEVVVVGVEDEEWGQRVAAVVKLKDSVSSPRCYSPVRSDMSLICKQAASTGLDLATLRKHLKEDMAAYKVPTILKLVDSIERNAMGKVNKKEILKQHFAPKE